jgi:hypothetical protein
MNFFELNSRTIGSLRTIEAAKRAAKRAQFYEFVSFLWLMFVVALFPFVFGMWVGLQLQ